MKKFAFASLALAAALAIAPAANAAPIGFSVTDGIVSVIGLPYGVNGFNAPAPAGGAFTVTSLTGVTFSDSNLGISATHATLVDPSYGGDNKIFWPGTDPASGAHFDSHGWVIFLPAYDAYVKIYGTPTGVTNAVIKYTSGTVMDTVSGPFTVVVTPEPMPLVLLGSGLLGLAVLALRKAKTSGLVLNS